MRSADIIIKKVSDIKVLKDLYPRIEMDTKIIQQYADNADVLPPIEINQDNILIDGAHRLEAYKILKKDEIPCTITPTQTEKEIFLLAIERNNARGVQLSQEDKKQLAIRLCGDLSKQEIIKLLSISERTYRVWTQSKRHDIKEERDNKILNLSQSHSSNEIDKMLNLGHGTSAKVVKSEKNGKIAENLQQPKDFTPQIS